MSLLADPLVIGNLVLGLATIIAAWVARRRESREREARMELAASDAAREKKKYGFSAAAVDLVAEVNDSGDVTATRTTSKVEVAHDIRIDGIPGKMIADTYGAPGQGIQRPTFVPPANFPKGVVFKPEASSGTGASGSMVPFTVSVTNGLVDTDPPLTFAVKGHADRAHLMTEAAVMKAYPHFPFEYISAFVDYPTDLLTIGLTFTGTLRTRVFATVFLGSDGEVACPNGAEIRRVSASFVGNSDGSGGKLSIPSPLIGMAYILYWCPPSGWQPPAPPAP